MFDPEHEDSQLERLIASAKDYVVPSDQLRGKVLDQAFYAHDEKVSSKWVGRAVLTSAALFWISTLSMPFVEAFQSRHQKAQTYIESRSMELFEQEKLDIQSATYQAYSEWRSELGQRLQVTQQTDSSTK